MGVTRRSSPSVGYQDLSREIKLVWRCATGVTRSTHSVSSWRRLKVKVCSPVIGVIDSNPHAAITSTNPLAGAVCRAELAAAQQSNTKKMSDSVSTRNLVCKLLQLTPGESGLS